MAVSPETRTTSATNNGKSLENNAGKSLFDPRVQCGAKFANKPHGSSQGKWRVGGLVGPKTPFPTVMDTRVCVFTSRQVCFCLMWEGFINNYTKFEI